MTTTTDVDPEPCRCGREVRYLNPASDRRRCVGCGYVPELCRCEPTRD